jgi:hypothetical protein
MDRRAELITVTVFKFNHDQRAGPVVAIGP